jgi:hypothetical protein
MSAPVFVTLAEAEGMLPDGDEVHTFRQAGPAIIGANWSRSELLDAMRASPAIELAGKVATSMQHGLAIDDDMGKLFIATKAR